MMMGRSGKAVLEGDAKLAQTWPPECYTLPQKPAAFRIVRRHARPAVPSISIPLRPRRGAL